MINEVTLQGVFNSIPKTQGNSIVFKIGVEHWAENGRLSKTDDFEAEVSGIDQMEAIKNYLDGKDPVLIKGRLYRPGEQPRILAKADNPEHGLFFLSKENEWINVLEIGKRFREKMNYGE